MDGIEELFSNDKSSLSPQGEVTEMKADDIFIENDEEKLEVFDAAVDRYLISLLHDALNKVPFTLSQLKDMSEKELNSFLTAEGFKDLPEPEYDIDVPSEEHVLKDIVPPTKSNVHILPLSLEDNSTIFGTMSILDNLAKTFSLPNEKNVGEFVPFDSSTGLFDVSYARSHFELILSQKTYENNTKETVVQMRSREKAVDSTLDLAEDDSEEDDDESPRPSNVNESTTLENERRRFENEDKFFWDAYDYVVQQHISAIQSNSEETYMSSVKKPEIREKALTRDHLNRALLHVAVERNNKTLVNYLIDIGLNVNDREGCGLTPLGLAVIQKNIQIVDLLVQYGAQYSGPLFTSIPSPLVMAKTMKLTDIERIFTEDGALSDEEDFLIRQIDNAFGDSVYSCEQTTDKSKGNCNRTNPGFVTPLVGDVGTCKTNNAVMSRSALYRWVGICPGDLHNKGYFCEAFFKVHRLSGFHCLLADVLKQTGLTAAVFKKKKFQEYNLVKVRSNP